MYTTGNGLIVSEVRRICFSAGIMFFVMFVPIEVYRTIFYHSGIPLVATNQSVAMLMSGAASVCSAWHVSPLTGTYAYMHLMIFIL